MSASPRGMSNRNTMKTSTQNSVVVVELIFICIDLSRKYRRRNGTRLGEIGFKIRTL